MDVDGIRGPCDLEFKHGRIFPVLLAHFLNNQLITPDRCGNLSLIHRDPRRNLARLRKYAPNVPGFSVLIQYTPVHAAVVNKECFAVIRIEFHRFAVILLTEVSQEFVAVHSLWIYGFENGEELVDNLHTLIGDYQLIIADFCGSLRLNKDIAGVAL